MARKVRRRKNGRFVKMSSNPAPRRRRRVARKARRSRSRTVVVASNPIRRRSRRRRSYAANPIRRRRFRRNPIGGGRGKIGVGSLIGPAAMAGIGGVMADLLLGYAPIPASFKTGNLRYVAKAGLSVAAGYVIAKFGSRKLGEMVALGGLAISIHDAVRDQIVKFAPSAQFGEYMPRDGIGYYNAGQTVGGMGEYLGELDYGGDQSGTLGDGFTNMDFNTLSPYIRG